MRTIDEWDGQKDDNEEEDLGALGMSVKDVDASGNVQETDDDDDDDTDDDDDEDEDDDEEEGGKEEVSKDEPVDGLEALDRMEKELQSEGNDIDVGDEE